VTAAGRKKGIFELHRAKAGQFHPMRIGDAAGEASFFVLPIIASDLILSDLLRRT
jgi:hypothetical protein